jgi:hypothetical protein
MLPLCGATFRAIVLADTASNLSIPARKDIAYLKAALAKICAKTDLKLSMDVVDGYLLGHHNIYSVLTAPSNDGADILFFYYTGHGYHPPQNTSPWPTIMLTVTHEAIDTERIYEKLSNYQARLTIIFFDCCNTTCNINVVPKSPVLQSSKQGMSQKIKKLFLENSGTIIATASQVGQPAYAFNGGSLFTMTFLKTLLAKSPVAEHSWSHVFDAISLKCKPYQTPYIFLDLTPQQAAKSEEKL